MQIGENLKKLRLAKGIQISRLARALKTDESYIERIENMETQPPVSDLLRFANALGTDVAALISGKEFSEKKAIVTKADQRIRVERAPYLKYESLAPYYSGRHVEPFMIELHREDSGMSEYNHHVGEEFHFVLEGTFRIVVEEEEYILNPGDSIYFDSSLPHALFAVTGSVKLLAAIYSGETMLQLARGKRMRDIIQTAKLTGGMNIAVTCPDETCMDAVNRGIEEGVVNRAYLVGDISRVPAHALQYGDCYNLVEIDSGIRGYEEKASAEAVAVVKMGDCQMLMKGKLNTAGFIKAVLNKEKGIGTGRRLSLVSIFELPRLDRFILLTDPGINPELQPGHDINASIDIINNAIDVARSLGISVPKVALMDANEIPSPQIPSTLYEKELSEMSWPNAIVYGPLSYDLALYEESARKKGLEGSPVAGKADILVVPYISAGNFLYKAWAMTMDAEVANVVIGASVPVIITSRSDSDMVKFLTICASAIYSRHLGHT
jgi:phosphate butyryltransferase